MSEETKFKLQASEDPKDDEEEFILNQKTLVVSVENNNQASSTNTHPEADDGQNKE